MFHSRDLAHGDAQVAKATMRSEAPGWGSKFECGVLSHVLAFEVGEDNVVVDPGIGDRVREA